MLDWIKAHPQRVLGFVQVTIGQIALWDVLPPKYAAILSSVAGLFQVWTAFLQSAKEPPNV